MAKTTSMFASLEGLPTEMGNGEVFKKMKPVSTGISLPAKDGDREFSEMQTVSQPKTLTTVKTDGNDKALQVHWSVMLN